MSHKIIFQGYFGKYIGFFLNKLFDEKYLKRYFLLIFVTRRPLPLKMSISSHRWFFTIFSESAAFLKLRLDIRSPCT